MKKLIRNGVFETNSSSAHSVSLAGSDKEFVLDTIYPDEDGRIVLTGGEFGWDWFKHNDALTKANYAAVAHKHNGDLLKEVLIEHTGCEEVIFAFTEDYDGPNWSYIDHDSVGVCPSSKEDLHDFIFNKNSWLFGGNDNATPEPNFYDVPVFTNDGIENPNYKYVLAVEGYDRVAKFKIMPTEEELITAFDGLVGNSLTLERNGQFHKQNSWSSWDDNYELSTWKKKPDLENKIVYFIHRNATRFAEIKFYEKYGRKYAYGEDYRLLREIEEELYDSNDPEVVVGVKYDLSEIQ